MRSVVERLRAEDRARIHAMAVADRVDRALALGRLGLEAFRHARTPSIAAAEAARRIERRRQAGRRPSACLRALSG